MTTIIDTIDIIDFGDSVHVVLQVGQIQLNSASLALRTATGTQTITAQMQPAQHYDLGVASSLVRRAIMVCTAYLANPGGATGHPYFAICNFFQGNLHVGSSKPFAGTYGAGQALADVTFISRFA
jgi:hypothetical protein